jgi:hypothetical protein
MPVSENKYTSMLIRKKFKKSKKNYRCCGKPIGNQNKYRTYFCCSYPMVYKRLNTKYLNISDSMQFNNEY